MANVRLMNEANIVHGCKQYHPASQRDMYNHFAMKLMNIATRYCRDVHEAQDMVQNSFIRVFQNIGSYDSQKGTLNSWMGRIVVNECLKNIRSRKFRPDTMPDDEHMQELALDPVWFRDYDAEELMHIIKALPDHYKIPFMMKEVDGYSHKEIAAHLGIEVSTSRAQLARAKKMIRQHIQVINQKSKVR